VLARSGRTDRPSKGLATVGRGEPDGVDVVKLQGNSSRMRVS
jgi:hypothetical protein